MRTDVIQVDAHNAAEAAETAAKAVSAGRLVGFATETVYGIAALASRAGTMERLREIKDRPERPFSVHLGRPRDAMRYVEHPPAVARRLMDAAWPGPLTLIVPAGGRLADETLQSAGLYDALCWEDHVGLRCPELPVTQRMLAAVDGPVVAPSANPAGAPSPRSADDVLAGLDGRIDLLLDCGPTRYGRDSTVVRVSGDGTWKLLREGVLDRRMVERLAARTYLFVCTGNTCRSPMAEGIARKVLAEQFDVHPDRLGERGVEVLSAGMFSGGGAPASPEAVAAARSRGANIADHRSRKLTAELIDAADVVFCMERLHVEEVRGMAPHAAEKVHLLGGDEDIPDPVGGGPQVYERTAERIEQFLRNRLSRDAT